MASIAGLLALGLFALIDLVAGTDLAVDDEGTSAPGSIAMLIVFVGSYGSFLHRIRTRGRLWGRVRRQ